MDIEANLKELLSILAQRCPNFQPPIFTMQYSPTEISDLFIEPNSNLKSELQSKLSNSSEHIFCTKLDCSKRVIEVTRVKVAENATDTFLADPARVIASLVLSRKQNENELSVAITRFMELNNYEGDADDGKHVFYEVYHTIYAIRVLLSNIPGVKTVVSGSNTSLPIKGNEGKEGVKAVFGKVLQSSTKDSSTSSKSKQQLKKKTKSDTSKAVEEEEVEVEVEGHDDNNSSSDEDEDSESESDKKKRGKKQKRRRSKK